MILKAKHNPFIYFFFQKYLILKIKYYFDSVKLRGKFNDKGLPILVISNHVSWWDGFWIEYLNMKLLKRKFNVMMLYIQLKKHWYFKYTGGFSVYKNSKSINETIDYAAELLNNNTNLVLIFPQGEIKSLYNSKFIFQKGTERIIKKIGNQIQILFIVNLIDYFSKPKPTLFQYIEEYEYNNITITDLENKYQLFYNKCIEVQLKSLN